MAEDGRDEKGRRRRVSGPVRVDSPAAVGVGPVQDTASREVSYANPERGKEYTQRDIEDLRYHAYQWKTHFAPGMRINIIESLDQVRDAGIRRQLEKRVRLNGWFDAATGGVSLYLPNIAVDRHPHLRLEKVLFHEVVGHGGLRMLLGDAAFEAYCLGVYGAMDSREKAHWIRNVQGSMSEKEDRVAAGAEYMAHLAEGLAYDGNPLAGRYGAQWNAVMDRLERDVPSLVKGQGTVLFRDELRRTLGLAMRTVAAGRRYVEPKGTREEIGRLVDRELESLRAMHAGVVPRRYDIVIRLGRVGDVLLNSSSRISDYPLELRTNALWGTRFDDKQERHPYSLDDIRGLVGALDSPLAVIESKDDKKGRSVVAIIPKHTVDADGDRCTFVVPITPITNRDGYPVLNIDSIYPKKDRDIAFWISKYNYVLDARTGRPVRDPATGEYIRRNLLRYASDEFRESWYPAAAEGLQRYASERVGQAQLALVSFVRDNIPAAEDPLSYAASLEEGAVQMKEPSDEQRLNAAELIGRLRDARALQRRALSASAYGTKVIENLEKYNRTGEGMRLFSRETEEFHVTAYDGRIEPSEGTVFVFGSNPEGRHGAGAARTAAEHFGAVYGIGEGLRGASYALPTKDLARSRERGLYNDRDRNWNRMVSRVTEHYREHPYSDVMIDNPYPRSISPERIVDSIIEMYRTAEEHPDKVFKVAYGNGPDEFTLNGYCGGEMAAMFLQAGREHGIIPVNVQFPRIWIEKGLMQEGVVAREELKVEAERPRSLMTRRTRETVTKWFNKKSFVDSSFTMEKADAAFAHIASLTFGNHGQGDAALQLAAAKWFCEGTVILPEDQDKVTAAVRTALRHKVDPMSFDRPMDIIDRYGRVEEHAGMKPEDVPTFRLVRERDGLQIYDVDGGEDAYENCRKYCLSHFGEEDNLPWCLTRQYSYWQHYDAYPKQIALQDGRPVAFSANDSRKVIWWDRLDKPNEDITVTKRIPGDRLHRIGTVRTDPRTLEATTDWVDIHTGDGRNGEYRLWSSLDEDSLQLIKEYKDGEVISGEIPEGATEIPENAFPGCSFLTEFRLPEGVERIGEGAFCECTSLVSVSIPESVSEIGRNAFFGCHSLEHAHIPDRVTKIGEHAFEGCEALSEVHIPDGVTEIGARAFGGCGRIAAVSIPDGVTVIGKGVFEYCRSLVDVHIPDSVVRIEAGAFNGCSSLKKIHIPDNVRYMGNGVFAGCSFLSDVTLPDGMTEIGERFFEACSSLSDVHIPRSVTKISDSAFKDCAALARVDISANVTEIGYSAFSGCSSLQSVVVPESVQRISNRMFMGCTSLTDVSLPAGMKELPDGMFMDCSSLAGIRLPEGLSRIGTEAFRNCSSLREIDIPDTVRTIDSVAFENCTSLTEVTIPEGVDTVEEDMFCNCRSLVRVRLPQGVRWIDNNAFLNCRSLSEINIPDSVEGIGHRAFEECSSLARITLPEKLEYIGKRAFAGCSSLVSVRIPDRVQELGENAFLSTACSIRMSDKMQLRFWSGLSVDADRIVVDSPQQTEDSKEKAEETERPAPDGSPSSLSPALYDHVHSPEFIARHGDWTRPDYDGGLVLDAHGEPKVLWHGSVKKFDAFDLSHAGDNTGITEYTDRSTGETVRSDSEKALFFTDNRQQAATYAFLGWTNALAGTRDDVERMMMALRTLKAPAGFRERITALKAFDPALAAILTPVDERAERPVGSLSQEKREEIWSALRDYRNDVLNQGHGLGFSTSVGSPISNMMHNTTRQMEYFGYFRDNFDRIRRNDLTVATEDFGGEDKSRYTFEHYSVSFFDAATKFQDGVNVFVDGDGALPRIVIRTPDGSRKYADEMTDAEAESLLDEIGAGLDRMAGHVNAQMEQGGFLEHSHLYPVFLTMKNPLEHDYHYSPFPDKYLPDGSTPTAVVAARQNTMAHAEGRDGVIYRNVVDPFAADTYGVFSAEQVEMIDPSLMRAEDMDLRLGGYHIPEKEEYVVQQQEQSAGTVTLAETVPELNEKSEKTNDMATENESNIEAVSASFTLPESVDRGTVASYVVPGGTVTLAAGAFENCPILERVALPEGLTSIRNNAFRGCSSLVEVAVPSTLSAIGGNAFTDCSSLRSIDIPDSVQSIGAGAFTGCDALEEIRISSGAYERLKGSLPSGVSFTLTDIRNREEQTPQETPAVRAQQPAPAPRPGIIYTTSASSGYRERTIENARSADVTLAFAADFGTAGERLTAKCAGEAYIPVSIGYENSPQGAIASEKDIEIDAEDIERMIAAISEKRGFDTDHVRLNIAGNGMATLASHGITQYMADRYVTRMLSVINSRGRIHIDSVRSGGQTGFDEAGIQAARALGIPAIVLAPAGWRMRLADDTNEKGFREVSDEAAFKVRFEKSVDGYDIPIGQSVNIYAGTDENAHLSNLAHRPFTLAGSDQVYTSVEQAFQAAKLEYSRESDRETLESLRASIMAATDGAELRRLGRSVPALDVQAWDRDNENIMRIFIQESFRQNPEALQEMLSTAGYEITHRQNTGKWREAFPRAFMAARDNLLQESRIPEMDRYRELAHDLAVEATVGGDRFTPSDFMYGVLRDLPHADIDLLRRLTLDETCLMHPQGFTPDIMAFHRGQVEAFTSGEAMRMAQDEIRVNVIHGALETGQGYSLEVERCILEGPADLRERVLAGLNPNDVSLEQAVQILDGWIGTAHGKQERAAAAPEPEEEESMEAPSFSFDEGDTASLDYQQPDAEYLAVQAEQESAPQRKEIKERKGRIYTLGLGNRSEADFVQLIPRDVTRVIDMRNYTTNKSCPWFNKSSLRDRMVGMGRTYEQMAALSGRTEDRRYLFSGKSSQTDSSGRTVKTVDYDKYGASQDYLKAKAELEAAVDRGERILVLGPEGNPIKGARTLLLGQDLARDGYQTYHIDSDMRRKPRVRDQETVITAAIGGRTVSGGDFTQLHFRSDGTFSKEDGLRLSERKSAIDRSRRMDGEANYGVPVTFEADSSNELDDVNRANVDSSDYTLVFVTERPSVRENRTLEYAGPEASSKINIPEDVDLLRDPDYQDRIAKRVVDHIIDHVSYRVLRNEGGVDPSNIRLHIQGSDLPHITSRFVEKRAEATDLSGQDIRIMASTGFDLSDRSPLSQEAVNEFISGVVAGISSRMERAHVNEEFPEISEDYHLGTIVSNFETGVGEAAVLAAQERGLAPVVHHTAACLLTFDNETLHGDTRPDEVSFKQRAYLGLEFRKTKEEVDREMQERISMQRIAQDAFAIGLQSEHVVTLRCLGFNNSDILDMVRIADESSVIIAGADDLYEFVSECAFNGISGAEKLTAEATREKWDYARDLISRSAEMGIAFTTVVSADYPASLRNVARYDEQDVEVEVRVEDGVTSTVSRDVTVREGAPAVLWYRGNISALDGPSVALVGGSRWSDAGVDVTARQMASRLADADVTTVAASFEGPQGEAVSQAIDEGAKVAFLSDNPLNDPMQEGYVDDITRNDGVVVSETSIDEKSVRQTDRRTRRRSAALSTAIGGVVMVLDDLERTSPALLGELAAAAVIVPSFAVTKTVKYYRERAKKQEIEKNGISDDNKIANDIEPAYVVGENGEGMDAVIDAVSEGMGAAEVASEVQVQEAVRFEGLGDIPIHVDQKPFRMLACGDEKVFLIEKNYVDVVDAIRRMWGEDVRIEDPSKAAKLYHDMEHMSVDYGHGSVDVLREGDMDGTRVMIPKPEYTSLFYVDGALYTAANAPESTKGLDSLKTRTKDAEMFTMFRSEVLELQKEVMKAAELEGLPAVKFANAYYPVIGNNHVDIYKGDTLRAMVSLTRDGRFMVRNFSPDINGEQSREKSDRRALLRTKVVHTADGGVDKASVMALVGEMRDWFLSSSPYESEEYATADREDIDEILNEIEQNYRKTSRNNVDVLREDAARAIAEGTLNEPGGEGFDRVGAVAALMAKDAELMAEIMKMNGDIAVLENRLYDMREQYGELTGPDAALDRETLLKERAELTAQMEKLVCDREELERQRGAVRMMVNDISLAGSVTVAKRGLAESADIFLNVDGRTLYVPNRNPDEEAVKRAAELVARIQIRSDLARANNRNAERMYGVKQTVAPASVKKEEAARDMADSLQMVSGYVNDRCIVARNGKFAYADRDMNIVSAFYDELRPFEGNYGVAGRASDGRLNFIRKDGRERYDVWFDYIDKPSEGFCVIRSGQMYNHFDMEKGDFLTDSWVPNARPFHEGWARIMAAESDPKEVQGMYNYVNSKNELLTADWYSYADDFRDGVAIVTENGISRALDVNGESLGIVKADGGIVPENEKDMTESVVPDTGIKMGRH